MTNFKRTKKGISNLYLFYSVDTIVFLEGGTKSFNKEEVYNNNFNEDTEDILFWKRVFKKHSKGNKFKFKSVGSKKTLKDISEDIINGTVKNVFIAMDSEFEDAFSKKIINQNIFYTCGYSYENDIWSEKVVIDILKDLIADNIDESLIKKGFKSFLKEIKLGVVSDAYQFKKDLSFFPRKNGHLFCISCNSKDFPEVLPFKITSLISSKGLSEKTVKSFGYRYKINALKHCYGHLLADYCCQIINYYLKQLKNLSTVSKPILYRMGINKFFENHYKKSHIKLYYKTQFV